MKKLLFSFIGAVTLILAGPAMAQDCPATGGGAGTTGAGAECSPGQTPPPAPPATQQQQQQTAARKEESDDQKPGFVKRVLNAVAGNKTVSATLSERDTRIAALERENAELKNQVEAQADDLIEATEWIQGVANGTIDPVAHPAPNPVAVAAAESVKTNVSNVIRRTGVPLESLQPAERATRPAGNEPEAGSKEAKEEARLTRLDNIWKAAGYDRQAAAQSAQN